MTETKLAGQSGPEYEGREEDDLALKLLHTADWHLGRRFPSFPTEVGLELMRARMSVIDAILGSAAHNEVDAVLCAGDLFDDPNPDEEWWRPLTEKLRRHARPGRPVVLLPGNHDFLGPGTVYHPEHAFRQALPEHVHVVDRDDFTLPLAPEATLYARPCRSRAEGLDLAMALPAREEGDASIRIGMVHGSTFDMPEHQTNFPIARDAAVVRGFDYLAIGDTHAHRVYDPPEQPTVYPGAPEPTSFGERDVGNVALVFFGRRRRRPLIRSERVARFTWEERVIEDMPSLRRLRDEDLQRTVLRLQLRLRVSPAERDEVEEILRVLGGTSSSHGHAAVLQVDRTGLRTDASDLGDALLGAPAVLVETATRLRAQAGEPGETGEVAQRALYHLYRLVRSG
ncbi:metallophosphoesterase family protein [Paraliomyxa miuraensis]|uniref:metallophosphoesterase family protein n=1 Tax=Paraliomyxa miuraensis TaxID=376150 RepID=UPI00224D449A|nr:DNA repair exonuclease [Paraliomyxa miuraensis]MCX4246027.1 DNA repair exonuclease [Paraliomyxa miuraensis]